MVVFVAPLFKVALLATGADLGGGVWQYLLTTLALVGLVLAICLVLGVVTAWLVSSYDFTASRVFSWLLFLPLAMPSYIVAFTYTDFFPSWAESIQNLFGAALILGFTLYPYVYMAMRAAMVEVSVCALEAGTTMGLGALKRLWFLILPLSRPTLTIAAALVTMEVLNDYGTVNHLAVPTFTYGIFDIWFYGNSIGGAAQLALMLMGFALLMPLAERLARGGRMYHQATNRYRPLVRVPLKGYRNLVAFGICAVPCLVGFLIPLYALGQMSFATWHQSGSLIAGGIHSLTLSFTATLVAMVVGSLLAFSTLTSPHRQRFLVFLTAVGYAVPGVVLAIGVMAVLITLDKGINGLLGGGYGLVFSASTFGILYGYVFRFLTVPFTVVESGLSRIRPVLAEAAQTLGATNRMLHIYLPLLKGSMLAAAMLTFVDCMKELPMTLMLRPADYQTLATQVWEYAEDEQFAAAAPAALFIAIVGIVAVMVANYIFSKARPGSA